MSFWNDAANFVEDKVIEPVEHTVEDAASWVNHEIIQPVEHAAEGGLQFLEEKFMDMVTGEILGGIAHWGEQKTSDDDLGASDLEQDHQAVVVDQTDQTSGDVVQVGPAPHQVEPASTYEDPIDYGGYSGPESPYVDLHVH